jgi:two-component system, cell cycle response regulator DivK
MDEKAAIHDGAVKKYTILIVEDDETSFILLQAILEPYNCCLLNAADGNEAINMCEKHQNIDLILMDLKLPVLDGYETTKKIKSLNNNIPVIAQTAYALAGDNEKAIAAGCNEYITKPINKDELLQKINMFLKIEI